MMRKSWLLGAAAAATLCVWTATSRADDTIKLDIKGKNAAQTTNLLGDGDADTVDAAWHRRHFHHPRAFVSVGVGFGYYPRYYSPYYYPRYYYRPYVYYAPPVYYAPAAVYVTPIGGLTVTAPFVSLNLTRRPVAPVAPADSGTEVIPAPRPVKPVQPDGTFQYDGGPASPVPMPQTETPNRAAPATVVPEGRVVSLQTKAPKYRYSAYGEKSVGRPSEERQLAAKPAK